MVKQQCPVSYTHLGSMEQDVRFELMDTEAERSLLVIQKVKSTPKQYPRKAGIPAKEPL